MNRLQTALSATEGADSGCDLGWAWLGPRGERSGYMSYVSKMGRLSGPLMVRSLDLFSVNEELAFEEF